MEGMEQKDIPRIKWRTLTYVRDIEDGVNVYFLSSLKIILHDVAI